MILNCVKSYDIQSIGKKYVHKVLFAHNQILET